jgi:hypothetical protein
MPAPGGGRSFLRSLEAGFRKRACVFSIAYHTEIQKLGTIPPFLSLRFLPVPGPRFFRKQKFAGSIAVSAGSIIDGTFRFADTVNITEAAPHFPLNINANQALNKNLAAFPVINNILNTSVDLFATTPCPAGC